MECKCGLRNVNPIKAHFVEVAMCRPNKKYFETTHKCNVFGTPSPIDKYGYCVYFDTENGEPRCRSSKECDCVKSVKQ